MTQPKSTARFPMEELELEYTTTVGDLIAVLQRRDPSLRVVVGYDGTHGRLVEVDERVDNYDGTPVPALCIATY